MELSGGLSCESYGVKVAGPGGEEASVPNITVSVERIDQLLELLRRNCVSPVTLRDVFLIGFKSTRSAMTQGLRAAFD